MGRVGESGKKEMERISTTTSTLTQSFLVKPPPLVKVYLAIHVVPIILLAMPLLPPAPSPGDQITPDARPRPLTPLPRSTQTKLRSTLLIPTLPHLLSELLHNSLDAGAGKIEIWIDPSKEGMSLRVEDDGYGMDLAGLKGIGQRWRSSKGGDWAGGVGYGPRGEGELD